MIAAGLMCGTSLDGIDVAVVSIQPHGDGYALRPRALETVPLKGELATRLRDALPPATPDLGTVARLDADVGTAFADALSSVTGADTVEFIASHGITLYHDGPAALSWQIGDPFAIRERCGATVLFDFRRADCAAGGQGAPLVPYVDALLFTSPDRFRAAINLGGIANVTLLHPGAHKEEVVGWDVGPGNMLLDGFVRQRTSGRERRDDEGRYAGRGQVDERILRTLSEDSYFRIPGPKSTGRERFGDAFWRAHEKLFDDLSVEDGCATLCALTARTVAATIVAESSSGDAIVSGGGVHNPAMMAALTHELPGYTVSTSKRFGIDPDFKEAEAFVVLGYELLRGRAAGMPRVTGARHSALLGAVAPSRLQKLLALLREELDAFAKQER